jgi:hypothetical protein
MRLLRAGLSDEARTLANTSQSFSTPFNAQTFACKTVRTLLIRFLILDKKQKGETGACG